MLRLLLLLLLGLALSGPLPSGVESAQILGLFGHPGKSHFDFFRPLFVALAERGHNISMYSYFPLKEPMANYTDYVFEGMPLLTDFVDLKNIEQQSDFLGIPMKMGNFFMLHDWSLRSCQVALHSPLIAELLKSSQRYDVIILEQFANDCLSAVAHLLGRPVIALSSCAIMSWHYQTLGTPHINSVMPMNFLPHTDHMGFIERLNNFLHFHIANALHKYITEPATDALIRERFGPGLPPINEIVKNTSLMLINQHYSLSGSTPYTANVVEVGGLHVGPAKPLPKHLQILFDESDLGVIYISWGSMVDPSTLSAPKLQALLSTIANLNRYTFVMRWIKKAMPENKPKNLHTFEWLPQRDLLCHPKVKAFVSHSGLLGTSESIYCGVPLLVTPFYGDQFLNAAAVVQRRFGVIVEFKNFDEHHLSRALRTILDDYFAMQMKSSTIAFRERPQDPLKLAVWWTEHVIATNGAPLVQSAGNNINWFVYNSIDIYICCLVIVLLCIGAVWKLFKLLKWLCSRRNVAKQNKLKKQ
ncbi:PREDICTED: UDP-glucuronosyltransferase 1-3 [Drosophila arizonae]|uniref:UDP-glucuronosyltransferase n=1 Tax=Drosophila arizonae TaxID=7263 RepID=A0ABM1NV55_DROAR|nr:PREDICTED: UDP-glucuronosyltransferase 1-3 [Drosophila arizonae]